VTCQTFIIHSVPLVFNKGSTPPLVSNCPFGNRRAIWTFLSLHSSTRTGKPCCLVRAKKWQLWLTSFCRKYTYSAVNAFTLWKMCSYFLQWLLFVWQNGKSCLLWLLHTSSSLYAESQSVHSKNCRAVNSVNAAKFPISLNPPDTAEFIQKGAHLLWMIKEVWTHNDIIVGSCLWLDPTKTCTVSIHVACINSLESLRFTPCDN